MELPGWSVALASVLVLVGTFLQFDGGERIDLLQRALFPASKITTEEQSQDAFTRYYENYARPVCT